MGIIEFFIHYLEHLSQIVPVEVFTFVGSFTEEIIAPIPSPIVMTLAGSVAESQHKTMLYLVFLAALAALAKAIGSYLMYFFSDKLEDIFVNKFGKLIGITNGDVESFGKHFGKGYKDFVIMFFARAIPIVPTAPISVASGILKLDLRSYLSSSFLGYLVRSLFYLYLGYIGHESYTNILNGLDSVQSIMEILIFVFLAGGLGYFFYKRSKAGDSFILDKLFGDKSEGSKDKTD